MDELIISLLRFHAPELLSERHAIRAVARVRWPTGPRCPSCRRPCRRDGIHLLCRRRCGRNTIFAGTPLAPLRRPRVRALLLALRAFALTPRGISTRELARELSIPRMTLWRHLHLLRALLPPARAMPSECASVVEVCHATNRQPTGFVIAAARNCVRPGTRRPRFANRDPRILGEAVRTWLNGTHHGVTTRWLPLYLREAEARLAHQPEHVIGAVFDVILCEWHNRNGWTPSISTARNIASRTSVRAIADGSTSP